MKYFNRVLFAAFVATTPYGQMNFEPSYWVELSQFKKTVRFCQNWPQKGYGNEKSFEDCMSWRGWTKSGPTVRFEFAEKKPQAQTQLASAAPAPSKHGRFSSFASWIERVVSRLKPKSSQPQNRGPSSVTYNL